MSNKLILTIRFIRSFEHRNIKNLVIKLKPTETDMKVKEFKDLIINELIRSDLPAPFKTFSYDTLKIEHIPFKSKSNDPVINCLDDDALILNDEQNLNECNIVNETEISFFKLNDYLEYKKCKNID